MMEQSKNYEYFCPCCGHKMERIFCDCELIAHCHVFYRMENGGIIAEKY